MSCFMDAVTSDLLYLEGGLLLKLPLICLSAKNKMDKMPETAQELYLVV